MPTIAELREQSRACMEAAKDQTEPGFEFRLRSRAIILALRAEFEAEKVRTKERKEPTFGA